MRHIILHTLRKTTKCYKCMINIIISYYQFWMFKIIWVQPVSITISSGQLRCWNLMFSFNSILFFPSQKLFLIEPIMSKTKKNINLVNTGKKNIRIVKPNIIIIFSFTLKKKWITFNVALIQYLLKKYGKILSQSVH